MNPHCAGSEGQRLGCVLTLQHSAKGRRHSAKMDARGRDREQRPDNYMVGKWIEVKGKGE